MPWWRLGDLDSDDIASVMQHFENDAVPGLDAHFRVPVSQLAVTYGRKDGRLLYGGRGDLISRWVRMWAESRWKVLQTNVGEGLA